MARATGELRQGAYREATATALVAIAAAQVAQMPQPMTVTVTTCPQCGQVGQPNVEFEDVADVPLLNRARYAIEWGNSDQLHRDLLAEVERLQQKFREFEEAHQRELRSLRAELERSHHIAAAGGR